jgi:hypothetical protein
MPYMQKNAQMLAGELLKRARHVSEPGKDASEFLELELKGVSPEEKLKILLAVEEYFVAENTSDKVDTRVPGYEAARLMSRFLGRNFEAEGLGEEEIFDNFARSLNTLFDSINGVMAVINQTLLGEEPELGTIRKIIGSNIEGEGNYLLISGYLERIQKSFLIAHTSFQEASSALLGQILGELDPEKLANAHPAGLKFGALRKAELYDIYDEKYAKMKRWLDSGQYLERLLRDFEKRCQKEIYNCNNS